MRDLIVLTRQEAIMIIDELWLATLTKDAEDAGTDADRLNVVVNVDGTDVVDTDFPFLTTDGPLAGGFGPDDENWLGQAQGALSGDVVNGAVVGKPLATPLDSNLLTNSSVRVGTRSDDAWGASDILLFGTINAGSDDQKRTFVPLAIETEIDRWLSTDHTEGKLHMPLRLVARGNSDTPIHRVLLLTFTSGGSAETDDVISMQIATSTGVVLDRRITDTNQDDLEPYMGNWYVLNAAVPFTRAQVIAGGKITLAIEGKDAWRPSSVFVFGFDTPSGRPNNVVTLCGLPKWNLAALSRDHSEGQDEVLLPLAPVV
jgi:hypothetical protein